jgi:hypothetical protein
LSRSGPNRRECLTLWQKRTSRKRYKNGGDGGTGVYISRVTGADRPYGEFFFIFTASVREILDQPSYSDHYASRGLLHRQRAAWVWSEPFTSIAEFKDAWGHTSTRAYAFLEWCLIKCEEALPSALINVLTTPSSIEPSTLSLQTCRKFRLYYKHGLYCEFHFFGDVL